MSDAEAGLRALQFSGAAAAACGFCAYFAAKQLTKLGDESALHNRAMIFTGIGIAAVALASVYAMFIVYRGSPRTKMLAMLALLISLAGSYAAWTVGWKKGGDPAALHAI